MSEINKFCEFSVHIAKSYGIEIAIIQNFFKKSFYLSEMQTGHGLYPTLDECCDFLTFWDKKKIRRLIGELYELELI